MHKLLFIRRRRRSLCVGMEHLLATILFCWSLYFSFVVAQDSDSVPPSLPSTGARLFLPFENVTLQNFTMLEARQFKDTDLEQAKDGVIDALWCQTNDSMASSVGVWYQPPGANNMVPDDEDATPLHVVRTAGQVGLYRDTGLGDHEGLFRCVVIDASMVQHTFYVGIYKTSTFHSYTQPVVDPKMVFTLLSLSRDTDPPQFTLKFNSSFGPPSNITCTVDGTPLNMSDYGITRVVKRTHYNNETSKPDVTEVTVTVWKRLGGRYVCNVSVVNSTGATRGTGSTTIDITVASAPLNVTATGVSSTSALVTWKPPPSRPVNYVSEVFYQPTGGSRISGGITDNMMLTVDDLDPLYAYSVFVVGFGSMLPSSHSNTARVPAAVETWVQLRAGPFHYCTHENRQSSGEDLKQFFRSTVTQNINKHCHCSFKQEYIHSEDLHCNRTTSTHVVYRAVIDSFGNHTSTALVEHLEEWITSGANQTNGINMVTFDPHCPVLINSSDAVCSSIDVAPPEPSPPDILLICLCVVLLLIFVLVTTVVTLACYRKHRHPPIHGDPPLRKSFHGTLTYVRYSELPQRPSTADSKNRPLPEEPALAYDPALLESDYGYADGNEKNMYDRVSFHRGRNRTLSLAKHAVSVDREEAGSKQVTPMSASNPLNDVSTTRLEDRYVNVMNQGSCTQLTDPFCKISTEKSQAEYINVKHSEEVAIPVADETAGDDSAKDTNETAEDNKPSSSEDKVSNDKTDLLKETDSTPPCVQKLKKSDED